MVDVIWKRGPALDGPIMRRLRRELEGLDTYTRNALLRHTIYHGGPRTLADYLARSDEELLAIRDFWKAGLRKLRALDGGPRGPA